MCPFVILECKTIMKSSSKKVDTPLGRLTSIRELDEAIAIVDSLIDRDDLSPAEDEYLDSLGDRILVCEKLLCPKCDRLSLIPTGSAARCDICGTESCLV
jgi:hypothetical protein